MTDILERLAIVAGDVEPPVIESDEHLAESVARDAKDEIEKLRAAVAAVDLVIWDEHTIGLLGVKISKDLIESWTKSTPEGFAFRVVHVDAGVAHVQTLQLFERGGEPGLTVDSAIAALQELKAQGLGAYELWQMYVDELPGRSSKMTVGRICKGLGAGQPYDGNVVLIY